MTEVQTKSRQLQGTSFVIVGEFLAWPYRACTPADLITEFGGIVRYEVTSELTFLVIGNAPVRGERAKKVQQARKKVEKIIAQAEQSRLAGSDVLSVPQIIDETTFNNLFAIDLVGKSFAFCGGFELLGRDNDEGMLHQMVRTVGGTVAKEIDDQLDYLVVGNIRRTGRAQAQAKAEELAGKGAKVAKINEARFLELMRASKTSGSGNAPGKIDFGSFVSHLHDAIDANKLGRALKMLRAESFQLYARKESDSLLGVVLSQTNREKIYASWLNSRGQYGCASLDLENCMGLQGDICKHLLVLVIGLVRAKEMESETALSWILQTIKKRPKSDEQLVSEAFIQYKLAQEGEIDWRPTETIPEDYYAF